MLDYRLVLILRSAKQRNLFGAEFTALGDELLKLCLMIDDFRTSNIMKVLAAEIALKARPEIWKNTNEEIPQSSEVQEKMLQTLSTDKRVMSILDSGTL